jgi:hypothetical protein
VTPASFWDEPEWVSAEIIREQFNRGQFFERAQRGELRQRTFDFDNHLNRRQRERIGEPHCTRSQIVLYSTLDGKPVALVHRYRRPSGQLGGSGRPDPKRLFLGDSIIAVRQAR